MIVERLCLHWLFQFFRIQFVTNARQQAHQIWKEKTNIKAILTWMCVIIFPLFEFMFVTLIYMKFEFYNFVATWYMKIILCTFNIDIQDINWTRCLHEKLNSYWKIMWWVILHLYKCFVFIMIIVSKTTLYGFTCWLTKPRCCWKQWLLVGTLTLRPYVLQATQSQPCCWHLSNNLLPFLQHFVQKNEKAIISVYTLTCR